MSKSRIWLVDSIAAANLARDLGIDVTAEQIRLISEHMAEHRASAVDLTVSRIHGSIEQSVLTLFDNGRYRRSGDWLDGCRSAEAAMTCAVSREALQISPPEGETKGQALRRMLGRARRSAPTPITAQMQVRK